MITSTRLYRFFQLLISRWNTTKTPELEMAELGSKVGQLQQMLSCDHASVLERVERVERMVLAAQDQDGHDRKQSTSTSPPRPEERVRPPPQSPRARAAMGPPLHTVSHTTQYHSEGLCVDFAEK